MAIVAQKIETGKNGMHHLMVELFSLDDVSLRDDELAAAKGPPADSE